MIDLMPVKTQDTRLELRVNAEDLDRWRTVADAAGLTLSNWIRQICNAASQPAKKAVRK